MTPPKMDMKDRQIAELQAQRNNAADDAARHAAMYTDLLSTLQAERMESVARTEASDEQIATLTKKVEELTPKTLTDADAAADLAGTPRPDNPSVWSVGQTGGVTATVVNLPLPEIETH